MLKSLPVALYHYISLRPSSNAVEPERFEAHLAALGDAGYRGVSLEEAGLFLLNGDPLPKKSILLTFDDGYLDNYVFAWPLLERYGHHGVVFAVADKLERNQSPRCTLSDVWQGIVAPEELPETAAPYRPGSDGLRVRRDAFISMDEARIMSASGVVAVQSHTSHHLSAFTGPRFDGVFKPTPRNRPFGGFISETPYGMPLFESGPALADPAFLPSQRVCDMAKETVPQQTDRALRWFKNPDNEAELLKSIAALPVEELGRMESEEEFRKRAYEDIRQSRDVLRSINADSHDQSFMALAWPWGVAHPVCRDMAVELGFNLQFDAAVGANRPKTDVRHIHRFRAEKRSARGLLSQAWLYAGPIRAQLYALLRR